MAHVELRGLISLIKPLIFYLFHFLHPLAFNTTHLPFPFLKPYFSFPPHPLFLYSSLPRPLDFHHYRLFTTHYPFLCPCYISIHHYFHYFKLPFLPTLCTSILFLLNALIKCIIKKENNTICLHFLLPIPTTVPNLIALLPSSRPSLSSLTQFLIQFLTYHNSSPFPLFSYHTPSHYFPILFFIFPLPSVYFHLQSYGPHL